MSSDMVQNNKKLFIGNLAYAVSDDDLRQAFSAYGDVVDAKVITDRMSGRSKGFAFVEFSDEASAQKAVEGMNGAEMGGRNVSVSIARPPAPRENRGSGGFRPRNNYSR